MKSKIIFSWSGGKDSALGLYKLMQTEEYEVQCLLTSISEAYQRISMHGVRASLLEKQAQSIGIPLEKMIVPDMPTMEAYETVMEDTLNRLKLSGADTVAYGDIFLEDLRRYREEQLARLQLKTIFPLWQKPTHELIREFIGLGFKTIITCVNEKYLDNSFAGRVIDEAFLNDLPAGVDPCGENGEFHSFVFDGPIFQKPVDFGIGEIVYRKYSPPQEEENTDDCFKEQEENESPYDTGFWYCDLIDKNS